MRYLMFIMVFILLPNVFFAQQTYVPDDNFEQTLINKGYDTPPLNDTVPTKNIETIFLLDIHDANISDLTGIEDFKALKILSCHINELTSLDLSNNNSLEWLYCANNKLTSLDLSNNNFLERFYCADNKLTSLDLSKNNALIEFQCNDNELTSLNIKNGNNKNMKGNDPVNYFHATDNPDLFCIQVDDSAWSANAEKWVKDDHAVYSEDCTKVGVKDFLSAGTAISIFPNPAGKYFTVSFELETPKTLTMTLTDLSGTGLQEFTLVHRQCVNEEIDVSMLSSGVYFLRIDFGSGSVSKKIVVE